MIIAIIAGLIVGIGSGNWLYGLGAALVWLFLVIATSPRHD